MIERTLAIVKPDAWPQHGGAIITMATAAGLVPTQVRVVPRMRGDKHYRFGDMTCACSVDAWPNFYYEHHDKPFFKSLVEFMASGPVLVLVLEGEGAIQKWRALMGPTDSRNARPDTVRGRFGASYDVHGEGQMGEIYPMWRNAVHGSDSTEAARREIDFFFGGV